MLVGSDYWAGLVEWMRTTMLQGGCISDDDMELFRVVDNVEEGARIIIEHYRQCLMSEPEEE